jgi:FAD/FMN-containing dehydrogenase
VAPSDANNDEEFRLRGKSVQNTFGSVDAAAIRQLRGAVNGAVIAPGDALYDAARSVYLTGIDRRPAVVVRAADAADVAHVVNVARESGFPLAVRSGGHSLAGHGTCDDGVVLDLSGIRTIDIDATTRTAWAGAGLTAGDYTAATAEHGLATGFGDAPSVGIGGIALAGGVGFLHRRYGMTIDSVLAAEIVTADGTLRQVDAQSDPDLFWAIRGGGGNFGVVTRLNFRLHAVDAVYGGMLILPATPQTIVSAIEAAEAAPDELSGMINVAPAPPLPFIPAEQHGRPIIMAMLVHAGAGEAGERAFAPLRALGPVADTVQPMRYAAIFDGAEHAPHPTAVAVRTMFVDTVDHAAAESILDALHASTAPMRVVQCRVLGGEVARVAADATAFAHRSRTALANVLAMYDTVDSAAEHEAWADGLAARLQNGEPGAYTGFLGNSSSTQVRDAFPTATWQRLTAIKARLDRTNVFRINQNIPPAQ